MNKTFPSIPPFWPELRLYAEIDSSNAELKRLEDRGEAAHGMVVSATHQYAGRGQMGSKWEGEPGLNLYLSILLFPKIPIELQFYWNKRLACLVHQAISEFAPELKIKWPNDLILNNKKIGGMLLENTLSGHELHRSIVGIGININQENFEGLAKASSLKNELHSEFSPLEIRDVLLQTLSHGLGQELALAKLDEQYLAQVWKIGELTTFAENNRFFNARVQSVNEMGQLVLETESGEKTYNLKEISWESW
ncbi:MAG: biotin--[acetyl-CoA-carboxylase] ligase [Bacteroidetes bacterium]|nr:MAG: biotin--[acetyl-CoA-carboxylase] ligase [Bacteroidota bacterium]